MATGTVRWFTRGTGFIKPDDGGVDLFAHHSAMGGVYSLKQAQKVSFNVTHGPKGPTASDIKAR
jgi:CspA family cold shock protein